MLSMADVPARQLSGDPLCPPVPSTGHSNGRPLCRRAPAEGIGELCFKAALSGIFQDASSAGASPVGSRPPPCSPDASPPRAAILLLLLFTGPII